MYGDKQNTVWEEHEAFYKPIDTITGVYHGRWSFTPDNKKRIHKILVNEKCLECNKDHQNDDDFVVYQCFKYLTFYVLHTATDGLFVVHPCDIERVQRYIDGKEASSNLPKRIKSRHIN